MALVFCVHGEKNMFTWLMLLLGHIAFGWQGYPPLARSRGGPVESKYGNLGTRRVGYLNFDPSGLTHA